MSVTAQRKDRARQRRAPAHDQSTSLGTGPGTIVSFEGA